MNRRESLPSRNRFEAEARGVQVSGYTPRNGVIRGPSLARFIASVARAIGLKGDVSLLIIGRSRMRTLNRQFRGKDQTTDVLSFPAPPELESLTAGDLVISIDAAERQAALLGHSPQAEIRILALHGLLHLAGWDHETDSGEMAQREYDLRTRFKLPVALIERGELRSADRLAHPSRSRRSRKSAAVVYTRLSQKQLNRSRSRPKSARSFAGSSANGSSRRRSATGGRASREKPGQ